MQATYTLNRVVASCRPGAPRYAVNWHNQKAGSPVARGCRRIGSLSVSGTNRKQQAPSLHSRLLCAAEATETECEEEETVELEIKVDGMMCGGCSTRVEEALKKVEHVKAVEVSLDTKLACVEVEAISLIDAMNMLPAMVDTIKELGFEAEPHIEYEFPAELT